MRTEVKWNYRILSVTDQFLLWRRYTRVTPTKWHHFVRVFIIVPSIKVFPNFIWVTTSRNGSTLVGKDISYTTAHLDQPNTSKYGQSSDRRDLEFIITQMHILCGWKSALSGEQMLSANSFHKIELYYILPQAHWSRYDRITFPIGIVCIAQNPSESSSVGNIFKHPYMDMNISQVV